MATTYEINTSATGGVKVEHTATLTKASERQLNDVRANRQINDILAAVNTGARSKRGWTLSAGQRRQDFDYDSSHSGMYVNVVELAIVCQPEKPRDSIGVEFQNILNSITSASNISRWKLTHVDGAPYVSKAAGDMDDTVAASQVGYAPIVLPDEWDTYFDHLFGLDSHIARIYGALVAAEQSQWMHRFHCALIGPPGCGKSDICLSIKRALGDESVMEFDATSTTLVGAQKELGDREELPRVLVIEEIEKADEKSLNWLLSVLDIRAEVRRVTARGNILRDTRMLGIATVNNLELFEKVMSGALASRFSNQIYFQRPPRDLLHKIVLREVTKVSGNEEWIAPALDYAEDKQIGDPRMLIALTLSGRERWLTGQYRIDLDNTAKKDIGGWQ